MGGCFGGPEAGALAAGAGAGFDGGAAGNFADPAAGVLTDATDAPLGGPGGTIPETGGGTLALDSGRGGTPTTPLDAGAAVGGPALIPPGSANASFGIDTHANGCVAK